jgi:hypothetical protein
MATKTTSLFLPEEHRIISNWLDVEPMESIPDGLTLDDALKNLGLDQETWIHSTTSYAVATILLERVQVALPQWSCSSDDKITMGRDIRDRAAKRTVELSPRRLLTINWADSGPGYSWPEEYRVTYVPLYDVFVVTGSVDSTDLYQVTDFALGRFPAGEDVLSSAAAIVQSEWRNLFQAYDQQRWAYIFDEGLIHAGHASDLADRVWEAEEEENEQERA